MAATLDHVASPVIGALPLLLVAGHEHAGMRSSGAGGDCRAGLGRVGLRVVKQVVEHMFVSYTMDVT